MTRKLIALLLVISLSFCMISGCSGNQQELATNTTVEVDGYDISVKETNTKREATTTVEGVPLTCEHIFDTKECLLYINEEPIELEVTIVNDGIEVCLASELEQNNLNEAVVAQSALVASIAAPSFITAAKYLMAISILGYASKNVAASADAIGNVISGVRYNKRTYNRYRTIDISAADAIRFGKMRKSNTYYEAYLKGNTVFISREITQYEAIWRLQSGRDVFSTSNFAAQYACVRASTNAFRGKPVTYHSSSGEGYYPHYHPLGRRWVNDSRYAPHCWFPY